ncbi:hypothetical protein [Pseudactinotalea suaedae]|jgi:hypothetical protein|uniref:hypothetical protein n=1 Tax=Pseudactinotalea suaedae TaxID=1524924 RepID=UPI0012E1D8B5|nr:hypothetical protein [Pseudactinotalea suaedae]
MQQRPGLVVTAGVVAAVLWQVCAEIVSRVARAGSVPPEWLPSGSSFPLVTILDLVPDGGLWLVGMLVSFALVGVLVGLGTRLVVRRGFDGARSFLAVWMVVVLAAVLASVLTAPIVASYGGGARLSSSVFIGSYWGVVVGWVIAAVVAIGSRRAHR